MIIFVKHIGALRNSANIDEVRTMTLVHVIPHDKYSKIKGEEDDEIYIHTDRTKYTSSGSFKFTSRLYLYIYRLSRKRNGDYVSHQNSVMCGYPIEIETYGTC
jgi:hypothetical protein